MKSPSKILILAIFTTLIYGCTTPAQIATVKDYDNAIKNKAMAVSTNGIISTAWGRNTINNAMNDAIRNCAQKGGIECKVININDAEAALYPTYTTDNRVVSTTQRAMKINNSEGVPLQYNCSEITKSFAYALLHQGHSYLDKDGDGNPCEWGKKSYQPQRAASTTYAPKSSSNCHWVGGYTRKNGTYVRGHRRCR